MAGPNACMATPATRRAASPNTAATTRSERARAPSGSTASARITARYYGLCSRGCRGSELTHDPRHGVAHGATPVPGSHRHRGKCRRAVSRRPLGRPGRHPRHYRGGAARAIARRPGVPVLQHGAAQLALATAVTRVSTGASHPARPTGGLPRKCGPAGPAWGADSVVPAGTAPRASARRASSGRRSWSGSWISPPSR